MRPGVQRNGTSESENHADRVPMGLLTMRDHSLEAASVFGAWACLRIALAAFLGWHSANLRGFLWKPSTRTSPKLKKIEGSRIQSDVFVFVDPSKQRDAREAPPATG